MDRRLAREAAMSLLYEYEVVGEGNENILDEMEDLFPQDKLTQQGREYIKSVLQLYQQNQQKIDGAIRNHSIDWSFERLSKVDLSILRLAIIEIWYMDHIPVKVSINEAVELAKAYSTDKSPKFINGLLASMVKEITG